MIYTIGHSSHAIEYFLELLKKYSVSQVVDVRSHPASRYSPQFNKRPLTRSLENFGIAYTHLPEEFGARQVNEDVIDDTGRVDFKKFTQTTRFRNGTEFLEAEEKNGSVVALMCSEGNPLECHRFGLIAFAWTDRGHSVEHILTDGSLKSQEQMENDLIKKYNKYIPQADMFTPELRRDEKLVIARRQLNLEIGYRKIQSQ